MSLWDKQYFMLICKIWVGHFIGLYNADDFFTEDDGDDAVVERNVVKHLLSSSDEGKTPS